jgi:hypothetical protein
MVAPLGRLTVKGARDVTLFKHGAWTKRKWPVHPEPTIDISCCLIRGGVRQTSNVELLFKVVALAHHSLLAWLPPMLSVRVASALWPGFGSLHVRLIICSHESNSN